MAMHPASPRQVLSLVALVGLAACAGPEDQSEATADAAVAALVARAASLELDTEYALPPGEALTPHSWIR